jgi:hypothetical protein
VTSVPKLYINLNNPVYSLMSNQPSPYSLGC